MRSARKLSRRFDALSIGRRRAGAPVSSKNRATTSPRSIGLKCDTATSIAHTPPREVIDVVLNELDADNVDAIVQAGTNLSTLDIFPTLEMPSLASLSFQSTSRRYGMRCGRMA